MGAAIRHASVSYKQRLADVAVRARETGSYIAIVVHGPTPRDADQLLEYVTDAKRFDDAVGEGIAIARDFIDGRIH